MIARRRLDMVAAILFGEIITLLGNVVDTDGDQKLSAVLFEHLPREELLAPPMTMTYQQEHYQVKSILHKFSQECAKLALIK
jgi:hypothetical protein